MIFNDGHDENSSQLSYNDDQLLNAGDYEKLAKAYSQALKSRGFMIVQIDNEESQAKIKEVFELIFAIKSYLFSLGGFLGTSKFYSLNERQLKKLAIIFDFDEQLPLKRAPRDKTKCLLNFLSTECLLIKNLIYLADKSSYEHQIKDIIGARLNLLSQILKV
ncbi:MAG: hypothetical protein HFI85_00340 [Clostridia bacterium]|jgi:hypothetical protein|nr:hypothetical protein [Clostridia bacterium]